MRLERADAEPVFALVRELGGDLRGRVIEERWWLVWLVMGLQITLTAGVTQWMIWTGIRRLLPYAGVWGAHAALLPVIIGVIHRHGGGQRTATERYIWWIWSSYLVCSASIVLATTAAGEWPFRAVPALTILAAFGFSMLAMVTDGRFLVATICFVCADMAMAAFPAGQMLLFGAVWASLLIGLGLLFRFRMSNAASRRL